MPTLHHVLIKSLGSTTMPKVWTCGILSWTVLARPGMMETLEFILLMEEFQWIFYGWLCLAAETCTQGVVIGGRVDLGVVILARGRHGWYLLLYL